MDGAKFFEWKRGMPRIAKNIFEKDFEQKSFKKPFPTHAVQGAYFFAERKKLLQLNGFDELFSPYLFEESDLSYRALKRGWKIYFEPRSIAYHALSATISKKKKKHIKLISTKNKLIFVWKNIFSKKMLISHFCFISLRLVTFNLIYWKATILAYRNRHTVLEKRRIEVEESKVSDESIFNSNPF
jgi:GT2 family glycosyltransferase